VPPADRDGLIDESGGEDNGQMGAAVEPDPDFIVSDGAGMSMRSRNIWRAWASS
jgi:hypothetical protein